MSFATVLITTVTLIIIGTLIFLSALLTNTLSAIRDKVDVNVYFVTTTEESDILSLKGKLEDRPDVAQVTYTSRDQALVDFRQKHANDQLTLQALDELGDNPLDASLSIKADDPSEYEGIVNFVSSTANVGGTSIIDRINYYENKTVIERLTDTIRTTEHAGLALVIFFALASIIIMFATVRLAIYSARDEIAVMRLVGASNTFIRGPFVVTGIIGGLISAAIALLLFLPATWYIGEHYAIWLGGFNLFQYYGAHFAEVAVILLGSGVLLGAIASAFAVRTYLKV